MFASGKLRTTLRDLAGTSSYVLVAAPAAGTTASTALAAVCDEVVLVSQLEHSSMRDLTTAIGEVQRVRGSVLGAVAFQHAGRDGPNLGRASSSLPHIARAWVTQWRASVTKRTTRNADTSAEQRLRALSTVATALEQRIAEARSGDALAAGEPTAKETPNASGERPARAINSASPTPGDDAVNAAGASATPPSRSRKRAAPTKRGSSSRRSKQS